MDARAIPHLHGYLESASASTDHEARACAENFLLDERPPAAAHTLYQPHFAAAPVLDLDDWYGRHRAYAIEHLFIGQDEPGVPYTFRQLNAHNRVTQIDPRLNLIRVEHAGWPCSLRGHAFEDVRAQIEAFQGGAAAARDSLQAI